MKPNLLLINCDDLGYGDLGCYGSQLNRTPAIDALAENGTRMSDFYAASPLCTPSRGALMTGCYPQRIGFSLFDNEIVLMPGQRLGLNPKENTLPKVLKEQGYDTMMVGKWHCGDQREFLPTRFGFDHYFGLPYSNDMGRQQRTWGWAQEKLDKRYPPLPLLSDEEVVQEQPDQRSLIERYVEKSVTFLRHHGDAPFFLYFAPLQVHLPLYAPERFVRESVNGDFGACVECVDWAVSVLVNELKKSGAYDDTLIVLTSDNGSRGDHGASNAPLRGAKGTTWEGGMRVPCIFHWKGHIPSGRICGSLSSHMDFFPTLAALAGAGLDPATIDGRDMSGVLFDETNQADVRDTLFYYYTNRLEAVRSGEWKLHVGKNGERCDELYNLRLDPGEEHNVIESNQDTARLLLGKIDACRDDMGDAAVGAAGKNVRAPGMVDHPVKLTEYDLNHPYIIAIYDKTEDG